MSPNDDITAFILEEIRQGKEILKIAVYRTEDLMRSLPTQGYMSLVNSIALTNTLVVASQDLQDMVAPARRDLQQQGHQEEDYLGITSSQTLQTVNCPVQVTYII